MAKKTLVHRHKQPMQGVSIFFVPFSFSSWQVFCYSFIASPLKHMVGETEKFVYFFRCLISLISKKKLYLTRSIYYFVVLGNVIFVSTAWAKCGRELNLFFIFADCFVSHKASFLSCHNFFSLHLHWRLTWQNDFELFWFSSRLRVCHIMCILVCFLSSTLFLSLFVQYFCTHQERRAWSSDSYQWNVGSQTWIAGERSNKKKNN